MSGSLLIIMDSCGWVSMTVLRNKSTGVLYQMQQERGNGPTIPNKNRLQFCVWPVKSDRIFMDSASHSYAQMGFVIWHRFDFTYSILDYCFRIYFGTATYVVSSTFSHLNPITNPTPRPNTTLTIGATARNPNYRGRRWARASPSRLALRARDKWPVSFWLWLKNRTNFRCYFF